MYGQGPFGKAIDLTTQVVNGKCPVCTEHGIFISLHKTLFRCTTCGADIEQKVNGKISYMPFVSHNTEIKIKSFDK
jgi:uncharacterized protein (DUF983 family)|tara:strand:- start:747 stop:974 length:228 start_codon:yes stop_codon:yes gene_type:complete